MQATSERGFGLVGAAAALLALAAVSTASAWAQQPAPGATPPGASSPGTAAQGAPAWGATVSKDGQGAGITLDEKQVAALRRVSQFFNELKQIKGNFAQTNPDGKRMRGRFSMKQPGRFRFDYGFGSKLVIISDGRMLAIQDNDIASESRYELDQTPFRMLLRKDVDLLRDARVLEVQEVDDLIIVALADKSPDVPGRIRLFLTKKPALELKEWVTTDAQNADTRIEISDLNRQEDLDDGLYKIQAPTGGNKSP